MKDDSDQAKCSGSKAPRGGRMTTEDRKLRNRLSQKAFRARQAMRIKELEQRLDTRPVSETDRITELEDRNAFLANRLFDCHKKLESLQVTIKALSDATAEALDMVVNKNRLKEDSNDRARDAEDEVLRSDASEASHDDNDLDEVAQPTHALDITRQARFEPPSPGPQMNQQAKKGSIQQGMWPELTGDYADIPEDLQNALQMAISQDPNAFSALNWDENSYLPTHNGLLWDGPLPDPVTQQQLSFHVPQIGSSAYANIEHAGPVLIRGPHGILHRTNSSWSDHITTVEYFLRSKWSNLTRGKRRKLFTASTDGLSSSTSFMLSSFICLSWPTMAAWHTYTKAHIYVGSLMAWRLNPTAELFAGIDPAFRPTKLQLAVPHPAIIDWVPFATLRDKLILFYSASPALDDLICEMGNSYVMEGDLSRLIAGLSPTRGYVGVWDLVRAIAPEAAAASSNPASTNLCQTNFDNSPDTVDDFDDDDDEEETPHHTTLPAPDATALFSSKVLALEAFKMMGMHTGPGNFLLDPVFFERHPELYDPQADIIARGVPLRPGERKLITTPRPMDAGVLGRYKELSSWSITLSSAVASASG